MQIPYGEALEFLNANGQVTHSISVHAENADLMINSTSNGGAIYVNADANKNGGLKVSNDGKVYPQGLRLGVDANGDVPFIGNDGVSRKLAATA